MKIAIMQPYFIPYPGYFRLICASDLFVIYDCVQFPRRGFVHRNKLKNVSGELDWITLPLRRGPMSLLIRDLSFNQQQLTKWHHSLHVYPGIFVIKQRYPDLYRTIFDINHSVVLYIVNCLQAICKILDIPFNIAYSSSLNIPSVVRSQERILSIADYFNAKEYINAPGGKALYNKDDFSQKGIKLTFLPDYIGDFSSIIEQLASCDDPASIRNNLYAQCTLQ